MTEPVMIAALHLESIGAREWGIHYSPYTGKWFVHAKGVNLSNGTMLSGLSVHRDSPEQALLAFVAELRDEGQQSQVVAVEGRNGRRHYRWNGAAFAEVPDFLLPWADNTTPSEAER